MKLFLLLILTLFSDANEQYAQGNYAEAASLYEQCLLKDTLQARSQAEVYYNLGNAYFKQGELSQSILSYERCLRLAPTMRDAKYNLKFAQSQIIDNIEDNQAFFLSNAAKFIRNLLTCHTWLYLSLGMFLLMLAGALIFALSREPILRKAAFYTAILAMILSISSGINASSLHKRDTLRREAIITQGIVNAKASPDRSGTELFTLHEGTKVTIHETLGEWANIHVGNNIGWVRLSTLERI